MLDTVVHNIVGYYLWLLSVGRETTFISYKVSGHKNQDLNHNIGTIIPNNRSIFRIVFMCTLLIILLILSDKNKKYKKYYNDDNIEYISNILYHY